MMSLEFSSFGRTSDERYGNGRHPDLPWGYWLTSIGEVPGEPPLVDEDGTRWASVREAFWVGRLGLLPIYNTWNNTLEFIASYLAIVDHRFVAPEERAKDIFLGDRHIDQFFSAWMRSIGLVCSRSGKLSPEGRAALLMLVATRTSTDAADGIGMTWIDADRSVAPFNERKAAADLVERGEAVAAQMAHRFTTDNIDGMPMVKLIGLRITREIPIRSTLWSMVWPDCDRYARDRFYLWLLERIDRWDDWSAMVTEQGARALTEHFLRLAFCDRFVTLEEQ